MPRPGDDREPCARYRIVNLVRDGQWRPRIGITPDQQSGDPTFGSRSRVSACAKAVAISRKPPGCKSDMMLANSARTSSVADSLNIPGRYFCTNSLGGREASRRQADASAMTASPTTARRPVDGSAGFLRMFSGFSMTDTTDRPAWATPNSRTDDHQPRDTGKTSTASGVVTDVSTGPNPILVGWSVLTSLARVHPPGPFGAGAVSHELLRRPLGRLASEGSAALGQLEQELTIYVRWLSSQRPNDLTRNDALAYWINLYNAGALIVAGRAQRRGEHSVLGIPGGFRTEFVSVAGESLSLGDIEHGKLRRFRDPRIHAALVCGSVSCPTLRGEPYEGRELEEQLDSQIRYFLAAGGSSADRAEGVVRLSRVFLWFGGDFVRPHRMPTFLPASRSAVLLALRPWLALELVEWIAAKRPLVKFQSYDWGLRCAVH